MSTRLLRVQRKMVKEMEERHFQDACDANKVQRKLQIIFHDFRGLKAPQ